MSADESLGERFGFRRRCGWCGVVLRGWQLNLCRRCKRAADQEWTGPPCAHAARWDAQPDAWQHRWSRQWGEWIWRGQ